MVFFPIALFVYVFFFRRRDLLATKPRAVHPDLNHCLRQLSSTLLVFKMSNKTCEVIRGVFGHFNYDIYDFIVWNVRIQDDNISAVNSNQQVGASLPARANAAETLTNSVPILRICGSVSQPDEIGEPGESEDVCFHSFCQPCVTQLRQSWL